MARTTGTHEEVAHAWVRGHYMRGSRLSTDGHYLTSYQTPIAVKDGKIAWFRENVWGQSTGKHLGYGYVAARQCGYTCVETDNIFRDQYEGAVQVRLASAEQYINLRVYIQRIPHMIWECQQIQKDLNELAELNGRQPHVYIPPLALLQRAVKHGVEVPLHLWALALNQLESNPKE